MDHARTRADMKEQIGHLAELHDLLTCLSGKWVPTILASLSTGPKRNFQLRHAASGISAKSLSDVLRRLMRDGFVSQSLHIDDVGNVGVGYELTRLGAAAVELMGDIESWVTVHYPDVEKSRDASCPRT
jgi:DNA-binding HxlR family transcriptional regulator